MHLLTVVQHPCCQFAIQKLTHSCLSRLPPQGIVQLGLLALQTSSSNEGRPHVRVRKLLR